MYNFPNPASAFLARAQGFVAFYDSLLQETTGLLLVMNTLGLWSWWDESRWYYKQLKVLATSDDQRTTLASSDAGIPCFNVLSSACIRRGTWRGEHVVFFSSLFAWWWKRFRVSDCFVSFPVSYLSLVYRVRYVVSFSVLKSQVQILLIRDAARPSDWRTATWVQWSVRRRGIYIWIRARTILWRRIDWLVREPF